MKFWVKLSENLFAFSNFTKRIVMADITLKYSLLKKGAKQELNDFIDFLLQKQHSGKKNSLSSYKKKILGVSTWTNADMEVFKTNHLQNPMDNRDL